MSDVVNVETLTRPSLYSTRQLKLAVTVASVLKDCTDNFGKLILLEPPENT